VLEDVFVPLTKEDEEELEPVLDKEGNPKLDKEGEPILKGPKMVGKYEKWMAEIKERLSDEKVFLKDEKELLKECKKNNKPAKGKAEIQEKIKTAIAKLKEEMKKETDQCKEKPVKERKECKDKVKAEYTKRIQAKKDEKEQLLKDYVPKPNPKCEEMLKNLEQREEAIELIKEEQVQVKEYMNQISQRMKELREENKELTEIYKEDKQKVSPMKHRIKTQRKDIMKIKDKVARKEAMTKFRETKLKEFKDFMNKFQTMRSRLAGIKEERQLMRLKLGKMKLKNISQDNALEKRCKLDE
jgi:chromosome segregation ATPase